jgi:preprotein translocase subunit SecE
VSRERRQRAKQKARRRGEESASGLVRADVPSALDHASADVDEFDAALVRGSGGGPVQPDEAERAERADESARHPEQAPVAEAAGGRGGDRNGGNGAVGNAAAAVPAPREGARPAPRGSIFARAAAFLRASWAELQRVQWPDRPEVFQATAVVVGFVAVMGLYLGAADWVAQKIINFVL